MQTLNDTVWAKLAPSPIDGVGVFAIRDIPKGQKIYIPDDKCWRAVGELTDTLPVIQDVILQRWPLVFENGLYWSPNSDAHLPSFMNHSDTPNCSTGMVALKDIHTGEELTEQYPFECVLQFEHEKA